VIKQLTLAAFAAAAVISTAAADPLQDLGKKLSADHSDAVVWLSVISKISMSAEGDVAPQIASALAGQDREEKGETTGTVIDAASGLIVAALGGIDKASVVDGQTVNTPMGEIKLKANSQIKEVKIITADGTEVPADLVMKDDTLGLAFIKARMDSDEAKEVEFKGIDLNDSAKGELLDRCVVLARMDEAMNRDASAATLEITGVTTRPRLFYRVAMEAPGCPVFLENGKLLGISVVRKPAAGASGNQIKLTPVVLPAADVAKVAEQAKTAEPPKPAPQDEEGEGEDNSEDKAEDKDAE
jgi:hypothetical protein